MKSWLCFLQGDVNEELAVFLQGDVNEELAVFLQGDVNEELAVFLQGVVHEELAVFFIRICSNYPSGTCYKVYRDLSMMTAFTKPSTQHTLLWYQRCFSPSSDDV